MIKICAWCSLVLLNDNKGDGHISHGICENCSNKILSEETNLKIEIRPSEDEKNKTKSKTETGKLTYDWYMKFAQK